MNILYRWMLAGLLMVPLAACQKSSPASTPESDKTPTDTQLRIYDVPADRAVELQIALNTVMNNKAIVMQASPGKLLVSAPADLQASIKQAIDALSHAKNPSAVDMPLQVSFWVIDGTDGVGKDDPALHNLVGSLDAVRRAVGPMHFSLNQQVAAAGSHGDLKTMPDGLYQREFNFKATGASGKQLIFELHYQDDGHGGLHNLDTILNVTTGQYVVLAQAPGRCPSEQVTTNGAPSPCTSSPVLRLLIVRVDRSTPAT